MPKINFSQKICSWRVRIGTPCLILIVFLSKPTFDSVLVGAALCCLGLFVRAWASGHLQKEKELTVSGPYQYTRNPLYLGNLILGISVVVGSHSWWVLIIFVAYFLLFYPSVIQREGERMRELFPEKYEEYKKKVPLFFPSLRVRSCGRNNKFSWSLYKKNKEYRAIAGAGIFWLILAAKLILLG